TPAAAIRLLHGSSPRPPMARVVLPRKTVGLWGGVRDGVLVGTPWADHEAVFMPTTYPPTRLATPSRSPPEPAKARRSPPTPTAAVAAEGVRVRSRHWERLHRDAGGGPAYPPAPRTQTSDSARNPPDCRRHNWA